MYDARHMSTQEIKQLIDKQIRTMAVMGLIAVAFSLWTAADRLATPLTVATAMTPFLKLEMAQSKTDLEAILGPSGSQNRRIAAKSVPMVGQEFIATWIAFLFFVTGLIPICKPHLVGQRPLIWLFLAGAFYLDYRAWKEVAAAAKASVLTDQMATAIHAACLDKWSVFFGATIYGSIMFFKSHPALNVGATILLLVAVLGGISSATGYQAETWIGIAASVQFIGFSGISLLLASRPEFLYNR